VAVERIGSFLCPWPNYFNKLIEFVGPIEVSKKQSNVATLVGKPWAMDMVDEGVSRPFKPWDVETSEFPASKRWHPLDISANSNIRRFHELQEKAS
jgi:hypothetical protein